MNDPSGKAPSRGETDPSAVPADGPSSRRQPRVALWEIFATFLVIGATSFGGGVIAYLRNSLVGVKGWLDEDEFLTALEISQALPGLNATNMSVVVGDRLRGAPGAAAAFLGMVLPGAIMVFVLGVLYATHRRNPAVEGILKGIGAASVGLLAAVTLQIGRRQLARAI